MKLARDPIDHKLALLHEEAEERDAVRRAASENLPYLDLKKKPVDISALELVSRSLAEEARAVAFTLKGKKLALALYSSKLPNAEELIRRLEGQGFKLNIFITSLSGLREAWNYYPVRTAPAESVVSVAQVESQILEEAKNKIKSVADLASYLQGRGEDMSTTDILKIIFSGALVLGVSDIHLEHVTRDRGLLRFRVDGILRDIGRFSPKLIASIVSRLKLLSELKLNITDAPQDGRFTIQTESGPIEARTSIVPAQFGEAAVLRILNPKVIAMELSDLGLRADDEEIVRKELKRPNGMILVTGPTGAGKTTTIYAFLKQIRTAAQKIITIEDPIEYHLEGIEQTQTEPRSGYTFATGLRSILRQDPDIILVGEIRDLETAQAAIHAALTGHLVFSTLHTNNAAGAIPRLIDLGVKPLVIGPALALVIAERLVRRLCLNCRREVIPDKTLKENLEKFLQRLPKKVSRAKIEVRLFEAVGCKECSDGYKAQIGLFEVLEMGAHLDALIKKGAVEEEITEEAKSAGMISMQEDGLIKAINGVTTLQEVERATGPIEWG
ncbi:MAG: type II/IV secretion system protein [Candidatus Colwellbacteria bacterium]|nr:type II/IV secretion system protein [Candidatus Colwellbacteria bacterium]